MFKKQDSPEWLKPCAQEGKWHEMRLARKAGTSAVGKITVHVRITNENTVDKDLKM